MLKISIIKVLFPKLPNSCLGSGRAWHSMFLSFHWTQLLNLLKNSNFARFSIQSKYQSWHSYSRIKIDSNAHRDRNPLITTVKVKWDTFQHVWTKLCICHQSQYESWGSNSRTDLKLKLPTAFGSINFMSYISSII